MITSALGSSWPLRWETSRSSSSGFMWGRNRESRNSKEATDPPGFSRTPTLWGSGKVGGRGVSSPGCFCTFWKPGQKWETCACVLMLCLAQGQDANWVKDARLSTRWANGGVRKLLCLGTAFYWWMTSVKLLNLSGPQLLIYQVRKLTRWSLWSHPVIKFCGF